MPTYAWSARAPGGRVQTGEVELTTRDDVVGFLRRQRLIPTRIEERKRGRFTLASLERVRTRDVVVFTRQLATMIDSGLPLVQSLDILARQTGNGRLRAIVERVLYDVRAGRTLAEAMRPHEGVFDELYVNMVAAGEAGGILDGILLRLAGFLEKAGTLRRRIRGAMIYPAVILAVAAGAVAVLLVFVIPTFQAMFENAGVPLPLPTRVTIGLSRLLKGYWWAVVGGVSASAAAVRAYSRTPEGRLRLDGVALRAPLAGDLLRKSAAARFTRTLGTLLSSGVSILDALEMTARTAGNRVLQNAILQARTSIAGGATISGPLAASRVFPPMVVQMIDVGEQTGALPEMLMKIADFYDDEVDTAVAGLLSAIEPVLIVFLGLVVGGMIVAMYLPIFDMIGTVR